MKQRKLYFKTDFKIWERCDCGFNAPFRFTYFTGSPRCGVVASYNGREYHGCKLMEDGRLCVAFDDHGFGLGVLRVERRFYLSDADYASGVCDEVFPPTPVTCEDGDEQYNLCLSLEGTLTELNASSVVPPYWIKGEDAKINGVNSINIVGEAVTQKGETLTIDAYKKSTVDSLLGDKVSYKDAEYTEKIARMAYDEAVSKQPKLESGKNIKTVGGESLLGAGDLPVARGLFDPIGGRTYAPNESGMIQVPYAPLGGISQNGKLLNPNSMGIVTIEAVEVKEWVGTQAEFDKLTEFDEKTTYYIYD